MSLLPIKEAFIEDKNAKLFLLREDLLHPEISGNKWRKLKYNILWAKEQGYSTVLTFGGAFSNHIAATSAAGTQCGIKTIGIIRGEETLPLNTTLSKVSAHGMQLKYISRSDYKKKDQPSFLQELEKEFGKVFIIPEGGSNAYAVKGCSEILRPIEIDYDVVACACGTGGTLAGIVASLPPGKQAIGFPALKGADFLKTDVTHLLTDYSIHYQQSINTKNWELNLNYHFGGYAKVNDELVQFVKEFKWKHHVMLDLIYTGKMMYGVFDLLKNTSQLDGKTIVAVHTGGTQGNKGMEDRYGIQL